MRRSFFLLILMISFRASAQDNCSTINLDTTALGSNRNQDNSNWCFANVAADLLSYKLGKKVSSADVKINYDKWYLKEHPWLNAIYGKQEGGITRVALQTTLEAGVCLEDDFPSGIRAKFKLKAGQGIPKAKNAEERFKEAEDFVEQMTIRRREQSWESVSKKRFWNTKNSCDNPVLELPEGLSDSLTLVDHLEVAQSSNRANAMENYQKMICKNRQILSRKPEAVSWYGQAKDSAANSKVFDKINEQLENKNLISIGFDASFLVKNSQGERPHGSTVIGRERDKMTGECLYKIRDSYACESQSYRYPCEGGNLLVPAADLKKRLWGYDYLK